MGDLTPRAPWISKYSGDVCYEFRVFYHPYVNSFVYELSRNGLDGLFQRLVQEQPERFLPRPPSGPPQEPLNFEKTYGPNPTYHGFVAIPYPQEILDFGQSNTFSLENSGPYSLDNWELFFHAPLLIADRLSKNQRFEEAQWWLKTMFDPTDTSSEPVPKRYWKTKPFSDATHDDYQNQSIQYILWLLAAGGDPKKRAQLTGDQLIELSRLEDIVERWRKDPFKPHLIARMRTTAYQKMVVMKYLDNLIAWADQLFRRDTIESINEATQLYILAAEILGRRPEDIPPRAFPRVQTYNSLEAHLGASRMRWSGSRSSSLPRRQVAWWITSSRRR